MQEDVQRKFYAAILRVLRPLARALLLMGIGYREFSELAKIAFVDTATRDYGLRGRPTNISRVAVMTGLTRKEVKRVRTALEESLTHVTDKNPPTAVILHRWFTDRQYTNDDGSPKHLDTDGEQTSFSGLVRKFGGDVPPGAMRKELERIDALGVDEDGRLFPTKRVVYNTELDDRFCGGLSNILYPAALNLVHNLQDESREQWWTNMVVHSSDVRSADVGRQRRVTSDRIADFVQSIDDVQGTYEALSDSGTDQSNMSGRKIGVGVFYFEDESENAKHIG